MKRVGQGVMVFAALLSLGFSKVYAQKQTDPQLPVPKDIAQEKEWAGPNGPGLYLDLFQRLQLSQPGEGTAVSRKSVLARLREQQESFNAEEDPDWLLNGILLLELEQMEAVEKKVHTEKDTDDPEPVFLSYQKWLGQQASPRNLAFTLPIDGEWKPQTPQAKQSAQENPYLRNLSALYGRNLSMGGGAFVQTTPQKPISQNTTLVPMELPAINGGSNPAGRPTLSPQSTSVDTPRPSLAPPPPLPAPAPRQYQPATNPRKDYFRDVDDF